MKYCVSKSRVAASQGEFCWFRISDQTTEDFCTPQHRVSHFIHQSTGCYPPSQSFFGSVIAAVALPNLHFTSALVVIPQRYSVACSRSANQKLSRGVVWSIRWLSPRATKQQRGLLSIPRSPGNSSTMASSAKSQGAYDEQNLRNDYSHYLWYAIKPNLHMHHTQGNKSAVTPVVVFINLIFSSFSGRGSLHVASRQLAIRL